MKNSNNRIFVRNVTVLDVALLSPVDGPAGRSWYVDILWEGKNADDGVLFDFALAKKRAKAVLDFEFDHRLWVPKSTLITSRFEQRVLVKANWGKDFFGISTYPDSLVIWDDAHLNCLFEKSDSQNLRSIEAHLESRILSVCPENVCKVTVTLREGEQYEFPHHFSYMHSLRQHYGNCQRFHGHSNIIEIFSQGKLQQDLSQKAADFLRSSYLVSADYLCSDWDEKGHELCIELPADHQRIFYSGSQGGVYLMLPQKHLKILPAESTIENISTFVRTELSVPDENDVLAYEGLQKGAMG